MHKPGSLMLSGALLVITTLASAQMSGDRAPTLDPSIQEVITGGEWTSPELRNSSGGFGGVAGMNGRFRAVVVTEGWEEVRYRTFLEWLEYDLSRRRVVVRASSDLSALAGNWWSLANPSFDFRDGHWILTVRAAALPMRRLDNEIRFQIGAPSQVVLLATSPR